MTDDLGAALRIVGERWALLIVREVGLGLRRFDELHATTRAPRAVLSDRLRRLVAAGVLETRAYQVPGRRTRHEYALTAAGIDLLPVLAAFSDWGSRHLPGRAGPEIDYRHLGCGGRVAAELVCECGERVGQHDRLVAQVNR